MVESISLRGGDINQNAIKKKDDGVIYILYK